MVFLNVRSIPFISKNLSVQEAITSVIPGDFSNMIEISQDGDDILLTLVKGEDYNNTVIIPSKIFNPDLSSVTFPSFILQISTFSNSKIDYNEKYKHLVINQNQLLYFVIHQRLSYLSNNNVHYSDLLKKDIAAISRFGEYTNYSSYNSKLKSEHSFIILDPWVQDSDSPEGFSQKGFYDYRTNSNKSKPIGELIGVPVFNKFNLIRLSRDLDIQPASESMASESSKFVISKHNRPFYKSTGLGLFKSKDSNNNEHFYFKTIFDSSKPNIPSRFKSHIVSDSYKFCNPSMPIFKEDADSFSDMTKVDALVVFDEIDPLTDYLTCGEIEISKIFASKMVFKDEIIRGVFNMLAISTGDIYSGNEAASVLIGTDEEDKPVKLNGFKSVEILSIEDSGINGACKIIARCKKQIGTARMYSSTGLKGMTKPRPTLGYVEIDMPDGSVRKMNVDVVAGMNAVKGGENTIMLAKAALMHRLGFSASEDLLCSMDEKSINEIALKFNKAKWTDRNGSVKNVYAGIIQVSVNELAYMYNRVKKQSFMSESGRYLFNGSKKDLFDHIWENNIDHDKKLVVAELKKIMTDKIGYYASIDNIPVYTPEGLRELNIFNESDLKSEKKPIVPHVSKLIDENYNKGFYLDLRRKGGGIVRFPSAKLINMFTGKNSSGEWIYPQILINVSKCLECCLVLNERGLYNIGFLVNPKNNNRKYRIDNYYDQINAILHTEQNFASILMKPEIVGVNMKQMVDIKIPKGVVVIFDSNVYSRLAREAGYDISKKNMTEIDYFYGMCIRNPVIWKSQLQVLKVWSKDHFREYLSSIGVKMEDEFIIKFCREMIMMNPADALIQQSDVDGDLMPLFVPNGIKAQDMMSKMYKVDGHDIYGVDGIVNEEIEWNNRYIESERSSNDKLIAKNYKLFKLPLESTSNNQNFAKYFINSVIAKGDVGLATYNNWALQTLVEIYKKECKDGNIIGKDNRPLNISNKEFDMYTFIYSMIVQDLVIRGIKWNKDGSGEFKTFLLANMSTSANAPKVISFLKERNIPVNIINNMLTMVHWGNSTKITESIMKFISLHNKGVVPAFYNKEHFDTIINNTFYGNLVKDLYKIHLIIDSAVESGFEISKDLINKKIEYGETDLYVDEHNKIEDFDISKCI